MSVTGTKIVSTAKHHVGQREIPMGSNTGPFVLSCQRATFLSGTGWPWCAAFVCKVAAEAGVPLAYNGAGAHDLADHHKATKVTYAQAQPGDVVDFNIGTGHTGILVHKATGGITTIDGNWGDKVAEHVTPLSEVRGFWRIPGVADATQPAKRKLPPFVVSTSANGHSKVLYRTQSKRSLVDWLTRHTLAKIAPNGITIKRGKAK